MNPPFQRAVAIDESPPPSASRWRFDRRIPMTVVMTIFLQGIAFTYFMGKLSARVDHLEQTDGFVAAHLADFDQGRLIVRERLAKLETSVSDMNDLLRRMDEKLDRLQMPRGR